MPSGCACGSGGSGPSSCSSPSSASSNIHIEVLVARNPAYTKPTKLANSHNEIEGCEIFALIFAITISLSACIDDVDFYHT